MAFPNRLLALAGCAVIAAACTQDTTTAPPVAAEVGIAAVVTGYGSEGGTITFVKERLMPDYCEVKLALNNLYAAGVAADNYVLHVGPNAQPNRAADWFTVILDEAISSRGSYRATVTGLVPVASLQNTANYLIYGWYNGATWVNSTVIGDFDQDPATGEWLFDYYIPGNDPSPFKIVNRCF